MAYSVVKIIRSVCERRETCFDPCFHESYRVEMSFPLKRTQSSLLFNGPLEVGVFLECFPNAFISSQLIYFISASWAAAAATHTQLTTQSEENKNNLRSTSVPFTKPCVRLARQRKANFSLFQPHESEEADSKPCGAKNSFAKPWIFRPTVEWLIRGWFFFHLRTDEIIKRKITQTHVDVYPQLLRLHLEQKSKNWRRLLMFPAPVGLRV